MRISTFLLGFIAITSQLLSAATGFGQGNAETTISIDVRDMAMPKVFQTIEELADVAIMYENTGVLKNAKITYAAKDQAVGDILDAVLAENGLRWSIRDHVIRVERMTVSITNRRLNVDRHAEPAESSLLILAFPIVKGKVVDSTGVALVGASIRVLNAAGKRTALQAVTDKDGRFELHNVPEDAIIEISYIGYVQRNLKAATEMDSIVLNQNRSELSEVVVNKGYYLTSRRLNTGSVSKVNGEQIHLYPILNPIQSLQGRLSGAFVQQSTGVPGGAFNILIRGRNSMTNGSNPLYIIDGVPFGGNTLSSFNASDNILPDASPLALLNPAEIASIEVLKDADATAIYGSRGANGVVLISTLKGVKGKTQITLNANQGVGHSISKLRMLNTEQYLIMRNEAFSNDDITPGLRDHDVNGNWRQDRYTDWRKVLTGGTAQMTNAQASASGGTASTQYLISGGYYRETTVFPGDNSYKKGSGKISVTHQSIDQKFNALISVNYATETSDLIPNDLSAFVNLPPNAPALYDENGNLNWEKGTWNNPLAILQRQFSTTTDNLLANATIGYELVPGFQVKASVGYTKGRRDELSTAPLMSYSPFSNVTDKTISSNFGDTRSMTWIMEPQLSYERKVAFSQIKFLAGATLQENLLAGERLRGQGFSSDALVAQLTAANTITQVSAQYAQYKYVAGFARLNYDWKNTYIVNLTGRRDGSSRFGNGRQFANFGAIGAAWVFSNEPFIQRGPGVLSFGKLRLSYGSTGNDQIGDYNYLETWTTTGTYEGRTGLYPTRIANPLYGWEVNKKAEAGIELGFFNDRVMFSLAYYDNRSSNQLVSEPLPPSVGFASMRANLPAKVQNTGWELELNTSNFRFGNWKWLSSFNITVPRNRLAGFPDLASSIYARTYIVGEALTIRRLYNTHVDSETGEYVFEDYDRSGGRTEGDRYLISNTAPAYYGGLENTISLKAFELDFLFQFVKQEGRNYMATFDYPGIMGNQPVDVLSRWRQPGDIAPIQRFTTNNSAMPYIYAQSAGNINMVDASFIRLKNVSLSYTLPSRWVGKIGMKQVAIRLQGINLLTISAYRWSDPESQNSLRLPPLRQLNVGVQLSM